MVGSIVSIEKGLGPEGRIAVVRLDRGDKVNALAPSVMRELRAAAASFEDDVATSVVILTGNAHVFSAGFDLKDAKGERGGSSGSASSAPPFASAPGCAAPGGRWSRSPSPPSKGRASAAASRLRHRLISASAA